MLNSAGKLFCVGGHAISSANVATVSKACFSVRRLMYKEYGDPDKVR